VKSMRTIADQSAGIPLLADDVIEFHAARLLLLAHLCGKKDRIDGLTKMAKLDFFVRYPQFFAKACRYLNPDATSTNEAHHGSDAVESSMIRYHYGPWDQRYYQVLAYMRSRGLLDVEQEGRSYKLRLTAAGRAAAATLASDSAFATLVEQMRRVKSVFGNMTGTRLKELVYEVFDQEVAQRAKGEVITDDDQDAYY